MRGTTLLVAAFTLSACNDSIAPNTNIGLRVWASVSPRSVSISDTSATLRIRLYVANPSSEDISVISGGPPYRAEKGDPTLGQGLWGSFRIANATNPFEAGPGADWVGQPVFFFEAKREVYDEFVFSLKDWGRGGWPLIPGEYRVRGWFNGREGESARLVLKP